MKFESKFEIIGKNAFGNHVCKCQPVCWGLNTKETYPSASMWVMHVCSPPIHKSTRQLAISPVHTCNRKWKSIQESPVTQKLLTSLYDNHLKRLLEGLSAKLRYASSALSPCQVVLLHDCLPYLIILISQSNLQWQCKGKLLWCSDISTDLSCH